MRVGVELTLLSSAPDADAHRRRNCYASMILGAGWARICPLHSSHGSPINEISPKIDEVLNLSMKTIDSEPAGITIRSAVADLVYIELFSKL